MKHYLNHKILPEACAAALFLLCTACGSEDPAEPQDSTARDSESESDTESAVDSEDTGSDPNTACLASISGRVVVEGADQVPVSVVVCIGVCFPPISTKSDGAFTWSLPLDGDLDCAPYDFDSTPIRIDLRVPSANESFAEYAFLFVPTMEEIADRGAGDYDLDMGDLLLYALPEENAAYTADGGADVALFGVEATIPPDGLVKESGDEEVPIDHDQAVRVFAAPLDKWDPPFVNADLSALYFLGPRWARLGKGGVSFSIEAPEDFEDGDTAMIYLLGGFTSNWGDTSVKDASDFMYIDDEGRCVNDNGASDLLPVEEGAFQACGEAMVENGRITTPPLPRLTWIGVGK